MSGIKATGYTLSEGFDVEVFKGMVRDGTIAPDMVITQPEGGSYFVVPLIAAHIELFGIDFLREVIALGYLTPGKDVSPFSSSKILNYLINRKVVTLEIAGPLIDCGERFWSYTGLSSYLAMNPPLSQVEKLAENGQIFYGNALAYAESLEVARFIIPKSPEKFSSIHIIERMSICAPPPIELMEYYVCELGIDLNIGYRNICPNSIFSRACAICQPDYIRALIALGGDPNQVINGKTVKQRYGLIRWLIEIEFKPFLITAGGTQWRVFAITPDRISLECLEVGGIRREEIDYAVTGNILIISLDGNLVKIEI